jgi:hypothetical protein
MGPAVFGPVGVPWLYGRGNPDRERYGFGISIFSSETRDMTPLLAPENPGNSGKTVQ